MTTDDSTFDELRQRIQLLGRDAFELAREGGAPEADDVAEHERAEDLRRQLDALVEPLRALPEDERAAIVGEWTDARLDVGYVLNGRAGPMSSRLGRWLESSGATDDAGPEPPTVS
jgi:hypothetical protein